MLQTIVTVILAGLITNNVVLVQGWGICPFLGVSKKLKSGLEMGLAVTFVNTIVSLICGLLHSYLLKRFDSSLDLRFLQLIVFILTIATTVQILEAVIKKFLPALYGSMGVYLPLITTNCAVLKAVQDNANAKADVFTSTLSGAAIGIGFMFALILMGGIREKLDKNNIPKPFHGFAIALTASCILALAFVGIGTIKF